MSGRIDRSTPRATRLKQRLSPSGDGNPLPSERSALLRAYSHFMTATTLVRSLAFAVVLVAIVAFVWREVRDDSVYVEPISVPPSLVERGLTSTAFTEAVVDRVGRIAREVGNPSDVPEVRALSDVRETRVVTFGPSLQSVGREVRRALGYSDTRVSGAITRIDTGWHVSVRNPATHVISESDVPGGGPVQDALANAAAIAVLRVSNANHLAWYQYSIYYRTRDPVALRNLEETLSFRELAGGERGNKGVRYLRALVSFERGEYDQAYVAYRRLGQEYPAWTKVRSMAAMAASQAGRIDEANSVLSEIVRSDEADPNVLGHAASVLIDLGRPRDALALCSRALRGDSADTSREKARILAAESLTRLHRPNEAVALLAGWTPKSAQDFVWSQSAIANAYAETGNVDRLGEVHAVLQRDFPNDFDTKLVAARYVEARGDLATARESYERIARDPTRGDTAKLEVAKILIEEGNARTAVPIIEPLLQTSPRDVDARHALADALSVTGQFVRADREYATVIAADPDNVKALNSWAGVLAKLGRVDESRSKVTLAVEVEQRLAIPLDIPELRQLQSGRVANR